MSYRPSVRLFNASSLLHRRPILLSPLGIRTQMMATTAQRISIQDAVVEDHKEMYACYDKYVESTGDTDAQQRWANQFTWVVARHAVGEELVLYPLLEQHLGEEGKRLTDEDRDVHQRVKELLNDIEGHRAGTQAHAAILERIIASLRPHSAREEQDELPRLAQALGPHAAAEAGARFMRTKKFAPTRAHPSAPNKPPFETVAGLMAAPIDKLRDMFAKFPTEEERDDAVASKN